MNNEKYNQIIDEAYENYSKWVNSENRKGNDDANALRKKGILVKQYYVSKLSQEEFINKIKTDDDFSKTWGLKIEEQELSLDERVNIVKDTKDDKIIVEYYENPIDEWLEGQVNEILAYRNIPTKLITITYKDETIEIYE